MIIALDYDNTYTREPILWKKFINDAVRLSHVVICVTSRKPEEKVTDMPCEIYYTSRKAKFIWAEENNIDVDIWIDDKPGSLFENVI